MGHALIYEHCRDISDALQVRDNDRTVIVQSILPMLATLRLILEEYVDSYAHSRAQGPSAELVLQARDRLKWFQQVSEILDSMAGKMSEIELRHSIDGLVRDAEGVLDLLKNVRRERDVG